MKKDTRIHAWIYIIIGLVIALAVWLLLGLVFLAYFLPSIIAYWRNAKRGLGIEILNWTLGWTGLGWIGALIWAVSDNVHEKKAV